MPAYKRFISFLCMILFSIPFYSWCQVNQIERVISNPSGKSIIIYETHEEIINMTVEKMLAKYGNNTPLIFTQEMFAEVNNHRIKFGLPKFTYDSILENMCFKWSSILMQQEAWGHGINGKSSFEAAGDYSKFMVLRENITFDNIRYVTIYFVVDNWLYLDDKRDIIKGEKRPDSRNHKTPIISKDVDRFGCGFAIDQKTKDIYITMRSGSLLKYD